MNQRRRQSDDRSSGPSRTGQTKKSVGDNRRSHTITINGTSYRVDEQLSLARRGRWRVWSHLPPPNGTYYTLIDVEDSQESQELLNCLRRLPERSINLPALRNVEPSAGRLRIVIDWCVGMNLQSYLERLASKPNYLPIGPWEAIRRMRELAGACCILHDDCRIIHGDLKPANLILPSQRLPIFLIDFGSSWQIEKTRGRLEGDGSDRYYSAPEVFQQDAVVDGRADQFSIAVILFKMLTSQLPYHGLGGSAGHAENREEFANQLESVAELSPIVRSLPEPIPERIDFVLRRALSFEPAQRFATMRGFQNSLNDVFQQMKEARRPGIEPFQVLEGQSSPSPWWKFWLF